MQTVDCPEGIAGSLHPEQDQATLDETTDLVLLTRVHIAGRRAWYVARRHGESVGVRILPRPDETLAFFSLVLRFT